MALFAWIVVDIPCLTWPAPSHCSTPRALVLQSATLEAGEAQQGVDGLREKTKRKIDDASQYGH